MCYSEEVSLFTFLFGIFSSILCLTVNTPEYKIIGIFFIFVILVQLIQYLLWKHQICDDINKSLSLTQMIIVNLQPIILLSLIFIFKKDNFIKNKNFLITVIVSYLAIIIPYTIKYINDQNCIIKNEENHLIWKWVQQKYNVIVYAIFILVLVLISLSSGIKSFPYIIFISYFISFIIYYDKPYIGEMWCFLGAFLPMLFFLIFLKTKS